MIDHQKFDINRNKKMSRINDKKGNVGVTEYVNSGGFCMIQSRTD